MGKSGILRSLCFTLCLAAATATAGAETRKETALSYVELGNELTRNNDFDRAIGAYNIALQFEPMLALAYFNRAYAEQARGKLLEAVADYNKTLELVPECAEAYANRAYVLARL